MAARAGQEARAKTAAEVLALAARACRVRQVPGVECGLAEGPPQDVPMASVTEYGIHDCYGAGGVRLWLRTPLGDFQVRDWDNPSLAWAFARLRRHLPRPRGARAARTAGTAWMPAAQALVLARLQKAAPWVRAHDSLWHSADGRFRLERQPGQHRPWRISDAQEGTEARFFVKPDAPWQEARARAGLGFGE